MNETKDLKNNENKDSHVCSARRAFLRDGAFAVAGTLALGTIGRAEEAKTETKSETKTEVIVGSPELVLKLKQNSALAKVGGSQVVDVAGEKVIVARVAENTYAACSAKCPHKNAILEYSHEEKQFVCPLHESRFSLDGKVVKGPAKVALKSFESDAAAVVSLKPASA